MGIWSRSAETKNPRKNCIWWPRSALRVNCDHIGLLTGCRSLVLGKRKKFKNFRFSLDKFLKLWYNGIFGLAASALGPALDSKFTCKFTLFYM